MWQIKERKKKEKQENKIHPLKNIAYFYRNLEEIP